MEGALTESRRGDVEVAGPYHGLLLVEFPDVNFEVLVPLFLGVEGLRRAYVRTTALSNIYARPCAAACIVWFRGGGR